MTPFKKFTKAATLIPPDVEHTDENIYRAMCGLRFPVAVTDKYDGIRGGRFNAWLYSLRLKKIPNRVVCERSLVMPGGFDVEICRDDLAYNTNESIIMSREHELSSTMDYHVIDWYIEGGYMKRMDEIGRVMNDMPTYIKFQYPTIVFNAEDLMKLFLSNEEAGKEGICFRLLDSLYFQKKSKDNRSTLKEQYLVKLCRYSRTEVTITDVIEQYENTNSLKRNALGLVDRSSCIDNLVGKDTLGAFECFHPDWGILRVGTGVGLTDALRKKIWMNPKDYIGREITIKFKGHGTKNKPRSPIFVGFREKGF